MTGIEFLIVFCAGVIAGGATMGIIRAERDEWRELARNDRRQGVYFQRRGRP